MAHQMHDTGLHGGVGKGCVDKPFRPSTTAIKMSSTYEEGQKMIWEIVFPTIGLRRLFMIESQNLSIGGAKT
ncbi:MAG: hypothetical protein ACI92Z_002481 [Paracoccaceae bacterium]|jgi:hypothetical protein